MDVFLYIRDRFSHGLDEIEDAIDAALKGMGEVSGTGIGSMGANVDIEVIDNSVDSAGMVALLRDALRRFDLPSSTVVLINGVEFSL